MLVQPLMPREAANRHFGKLLASMLDYLVEVGKQEEVRGKPRHPASARLQRGDLKSERLSI